MEVTSIRNYQDVGEVIRGSVDALGGTGSGYQLASSAIALTSTITNTQWVRSILLTYWASVVSPVLTLYIYNLDNNGDIVCQTTQGLVSSAFAYGQYSTVIAPNDCASSLSKLYFLGDKTKFGIKNAGTSTINLWVNLQLLGLENNFGRTSGEE